jgi:hypothetical protein
MIDGQAESVPEGALTLVSAARQLGQTRDSPKLAECHQIADPGPRVVGAELGRP